MTEISWEERALGKTALIARFKPLHVGGALLLKYACQQSDHVIIGIGSSNKYNMRNPFTADESEDMVRAYLKDFNNYELMHIPDFAHIPEFRDGQRWKNYVISLFGELDHFISGNEYVKQLFSDTYNVVSSYEIIPPSERIPIKGTEVRVAMAKNLPWDHMVPKDVAEYIIDNGLDKRFRKEFGLQTLSLLTMDETYKLRESAKQEQEHTWVS